MKAGAQKGWTMAKALIMHKVAKKTAAATGDGARARVAATETEEAREQPRRQRQPHAAMTAWATAEGGETGGAVVRDASADGTAVRDIDEGAETAMHSRWHTHGSDGHEEIEEDGGVEGADGRRNIAGSSAEGGSAKAGGGSSGSASGSGRRARDRRGSASRMQDEESGDDSDRTSGKGLNIVEIGSEDELESERTAATIAARR